LSRWRRGPVVNVNNDAITCKRAESGFVVRYWLVVSAGRWPAGGRSQGTGGRHAVLTVAGWAGRLGTE